MDVFTHVEAYTGEVRIKNLIRTFNPRPGQTLYMQRLTAPRMPSPAPGSGWRRMGSVRRDRAQFPTDGGRVEVVETRAQYWILDDGGYSA